MGAKSSQRVALKNVMGGTSTSLPVSEGSSKRGCVEHYDDGTLKAHVFVFVYKGATKERAGFHGSLLFGETKVVQYAG